MHYVEKIVYGGDIDQEIIKYDYKYSKIVELQYQKPNKKISLLGLHMNPTDEMWNLIFDSYKENKHTFAAGDFNAYEYRGSMKNKPQQLRNLNFNSVIPSNVITEYKDNSSVDNIYVDADFNLCTNISVEVKRLVNFETDHALCKLEIAMD